MTRKFSTQTATGSLLVLALTLSATPVNAVDAPVTNSAQPAQAAAAPQPATTTPAVAVPQASGTNSQPAANVSQPAAPQATAAPAEDAGGKMLFKPGQSLSINTDQEDIAPTYDVDLATKQAAAYPDSPEAAFILAVALSRTSRVEDALKEVRHSQKLAESKGGSTYFDKMIATYENMLKSYPDDNRVRYGLAWAYYMKAYLLARDSRRAVAFKTANPTLKAQVEAQQKANAAVAAANNPLLAGLTGSPEPAEKAPTKPSPARQTGGVATSGNVNQAVKKALTGNPMDAAAALSILSANAGTLNSGKPPSLESIPHIPGALEKVDPIDVPQIRFFFERALGKIDEVLKSDPIDVWSINYGAHLRAEYTGNLEAAMKTWRNSASKFPNNPSSYFFLGEGYLKQGNLQESIKSISRALMLRSM